MEQYIYIYITLRKILVSYSVLSETFITEFLRLSYVLLCIEEFNNIGIHMLYNTFNVLHLCQNFQSKLTSKQH